MGDVVQLFGGPVARLYRRSLEDQGFEVLMMAVFEIAARQGYPVARSIVKDLAAVPNIPLPEAWLRVLRHVGPTEKVRHGEAGDRERALVLLDAARGPFEEIDMPGWARRADELRRQLEG